MTKITNSLSATELLRYESSKNLEIGGTARQTVILPTSVQEDRQFQNLEIIRCGSTDLTGSQNHNNFGQNNRTLKNFRNRKRMKNFFGDQKGSSFVIYFDQGLIRISYT